MNVEQFKQQLAEQGYSAAEQREFEPGFANEMHSHDFSARALVLRGTFTLVLESGAVSHEPGESCQLAAGTLHAEQTGADGATLLIGRK